MLVQPARAEALEWDERCARTIDILHRTQADLFKYWSEMTSLIAVCGAGSHGRPLETEF